MVYYKREIVRGIMNKIQMVFVWLVVSILLCVVFSCSEEEENGVCQVNEDADTQQYVIAHSQTGVLWLRCAIGQEWNDKSCKCEGEPTKLNLTDAMQACPEGFVFPSNQDMVSVICNYQGSAQTQTCPEDLYENCGQCSICNAMFGNDDGIYPSSDLVPQEDWGKEGWIVDIWDFGVACHYADWDDGVSSTMYNVRCIKQN